MEGNLVTPVESDRASTEAKGIFWKHMWPMEVLPHSVVDPFFPSDTFSPTCTRTWKREVTPPPPGAILRFECRLFYFGRDRRVR